MPLKNCPECGRRVSRRAAFCLGCGAALGGVAGIHRRLKVHSFLCWVVMGGGFWLWLGVPYFGEVRVVVAKALMYAGAVWYFITKARIWWHRNSSD